MHKNIGYHTRLYSNSAVKVCGGSFGGGLDSDTVERLVKSHFTVTIKPSGTPVFVDKEGREVYLYISVDARETEAGKAALKAYHEDNRKAWAEQEEQERLNACEYGDLMDGLTHEEIIRRLKGL